MMSRFSGKCDFYDFLEIRGILNNEKNFEDFKKKSVVYVNDVPLKFDNIKDLMPYYTHIIGIQFSDSERTVVHLSSKSWLEIEDERYFPSQYRLTMMKEFDDFLKSNGTKINWDIPLETREKWTPCPLGESYFCEPKLKNGTGTAYETRFCPYMYANRKMPCKLQKKANTVKMVNADE